MMAQYLNSKLRNLILLMVLWPAFVAAAPCDELISLPKLRSCIGVDMATTPKMEFAQSAADSGDAGSQATLPPAGEIMAGAKDRLAVLGDLSGLHPSREVWEVAAQLQTLLDTYPRSREALLIRRGNVGGADLKLLQDLARRWAEDNPLHKGPEIAISQQATTESTPAKTANWLAAKPVEIFNQVAVAEPARAVDATVNAPQVSRVLSQREHFDFRKETTVLVIQLTKLNNGVLQWFAHGTGSFIGPNLVLTNTHVVESDDGILGHSFLVVNQSLGISRAMVLGRGMDANGQGVDAAVLQVLDFSSNSYLQVSDQVQEGDQIVLAGFPAKLSKFDKAFLDLKSRINSGVIPTNDSIPLPKFSSGAVQSVFVDQSNDLEALSADLEVAAGASGSSLTNQCGHLVALFHSATTAKMDKEGYVDAAMYNFSATSREVVKWLDSARIPYQKASAPCE